MPIYDYRCTKCGKKFDILLTSIPKTSPHPACPHCHGKDTERLLSRFMSKKSGAGDDDFDAGDLGDDGAGAGDSGEDFSADAGDDQGAD